MIDYIVLTWNSGETLARCLESIRRYGRPNKIIIIDRLSTDNTLDIASEYGCEIRQKDAGMGYSRQMGAYYASTPRIAYVDSDVELTADWSKVLESDAPIVSGYYDDLYIKDLPKNFIGKAGFIGCCIVDQDLILQCQEMERWDYAEDSRFARWYQKPWLVLDAKTIHHRTDSAERWRKYGRALRDIEGLSLGNVRRILGGAVIGYPMGTGDTYLKNWWVRWHYLEGYFGRIS